MPVRPFITRAVEEAIDEALSPLTHFHDRQRGKYSALKAYTPKQIMRAANHLRMRRPSRLLPTLKALHMAKTERRRLLATPGMGASAEANRALISLSRCKAILGELMYHRRPLPPQQSHFPFYHPS